MKPGRWIALAAILLATTAMAMDIGFHAAAGLSPKNRLGETVFFVPWVLVGALIVSRDRRNRIGLICIGVTLAATSAGAATGYAYYSMVHLGRGSPIAELAAWYQAWASAPSFLLMAILFPLLFPSGRFLSRRWRAVAYLATALVSINSVAVGLTPGRFNLNEVHVGHNPVGVGPAGRFLDVVNAVTFWGVLVLILVSIAGLVVRFRRSQGVERQQMKWFVSAVLTLALVPFVLVGLDALAGSTPEWVFDVTFGVFASLMPIAVGIAVLRYRLYDIDTVINKTLVYAALSLLLGVGYLGGVAILQAILPVEGNDLAVAASTLAAAALFAPLRRRIQGFVDHRFYRRKYDAAHTIDSFSSRLRQETDLDQLRTELLSVVSSTMQPSHASLWLREARTA